MAEPSIFKELARLVGAILVHQYTARQNAERSFQHTHIRIEHHMRNLGAAQKRLGNGGVLHHVTMSYDMDGEIMTQVLRIGREKISDKGIASAAKRDDPLKSQTGLPRAAIIDRMKETFAGLTGATPGDITAEEYAAAEALVESKFTTDEWLNRVP